METNRNMRHFFVFLIVLSQGYLSAGQQPVEIHNFGNPRLKDEMTNACRSLDGGIFSCGRAETENGAGWDGLVVKINQTGDLIFRRRIGLVSADESIQAIAEDNSGRIWIGGQTDSAGLQRAWLRFLNPDGENIWSEHRFFVSERRSAQVMDILPSRQTSLVAAAGTIGNHAWFCLFKQQNGGKLFEPRVIDRIEGMSDLKIEKLSLAEYHDAWFLYGCATQTSGQTRVFLVKLNLSGMVTRSVLYPLNDQIVETGSCVVADGGYLLGVGTARVPLMQEEAFVLKMPIDLSKDSLVFHTFGGQDAANPGRRYDGAVDILPIDEREFLVIGSTQSHKRGAQVSNYATWRVSKFGAPLPFRMADYGDELSERAVKGIRMLNGDLWICGVKNGGNRLSEDPNFEFLRIQSLSLPFTEANTEEVGFQTMDTVLAISPGATAAFSFQVQNLSDHKVEGLKLIASNPFDSKVCRFGGPYNIPLLEPGERYQGAIPAWVDAGTAPSKISFRLQLLNFNNTVLDTLRAVAVIGTGQAPEIELLGAVAEFSQKSQIVKGNLTFVDVTFKNIGNGDARNVALAFLEPQGTVLDGSKDFFAVQEWKAGEVRTFRIGLKASTFGAMQEVDLQAFLNGENLPELKPFSVKLQVIDVETASLERAKILPADDMEVVWNDGSDNMMRKTNRKAYELYISIYSVEPISLENILLVHAHKSGTDTIVLNGKKSDEVQLKLKSNKNKFNVYSASLLANLEEGDNVMQFHVRKGNKRAETAPLTLQYQANENVLHVISIGVPDESGKLKFPQKDAQDMVRLFKMQEHQTFGEVRTTLLVSKDSTRAASIAGTLKQFNILKEQRALKPSDVVLLYISTHGIISDQDGMFRLQGSDFERNNEGFTSLSFSDNILKPLGNLGCHVFVLLDACHSGAAENRKGDFDDIPGRILRDLHNAPKEVRVVMSCKAQESSFEDEQWQNSAFVRSLYDLLSDRQKCQELDVDKNNYLSIKELFARFPNEVNTLVKKVRKGESQTPTTTDRVLSEDNVPFWTY